MRVILASASERRQELLKRVVKNFEIQVSNFDESIIKYYNNPEEFVMQLSNGKAEYVHNKLKKNENAIIIGCDTVVVIDNKVLGKPKDREDAYRMLKELSGNKHQVYSGLTIINTYDNKVIRDYVCTDVFFSSITDQNINEYIDTKEPFDKAGAYGIQGYGGVFVEKIIGCYYNIVGLPINKLKTMLTGMGVNE